jgi:hypothetical protein
VLTSPSTSINPDVLGFVIPSFTSKIPSSSSSISTVSGMPSPSVSIPVTLSLKSTSPPEFTSLSKGFSCNSVAGFVIPFVASKFDTLFVSVASILSSNPSPSPSVLLKVFPKPLSSISLVPSLSESVSR